MDITTVDEGVGWACEALILIGHHVQKIAGRKGKTLAKFERISRSLSQCRESRPEYGTILLASPFPVAQRFVSLQKQRDSVVAVLNLVLTAVEREMRAAHVDSKITRQRGRAGDESFAWGVEDSPFMTSVTDAINQIGEVEISPALDKLFAQVSESSLG